MHAPVLTALGWLLLNSFWQFALAWLVYRLLLLVVPASTAGRRHQIALSTLVVTLIAAVIFSFRFYPGASPFIVPFQHTDRSQLILNLSQQLMPLAGLLWIACMVWQTVGIIRRQNATDALAKQSMPLPGRWKLYVNETAALLGIQRSVQLLVTAKAVSVQVSGWLRPVIILPLATLNSLSVPQMEAVLLHELVHIRQHDYLVNLLLAACDWFFFFNPFLRLFTQAIRREREFRCDDMVLQFRYPAPDYAEALLQLARTQSNQLKYALPATGNGDQQLLQRVQRMLGLPQEPGKQRYAGALIALLIAALILIGAGAENNRTVSYPGLLNPVLADNTQTPFTSGKEQELTITLKKPAQVKPSAKAIHPGDKKQQPKQRLEALDAVTTENLALEAGLPEQLLHEANNRKTIDFTMDAVEPDFRTVPDPSATTLEKPFVPSQSFSYIITEDLRANDDPAAVARRDADVQQAKSPFRLTAKEKQALQSQLRYSNEDLARLQKTIAALAPATTNTTSEQELSPMTQKSVQLFEELKRQLAEKEQLIQILQQRLENASKDYSEQAKQLQRVYKLRRIINI
jgi:beta-lactamase regulating signal transducer with metallopeptidase domain